MNLILAFFLIVFEAVFEGLKTAGLYNASEIVEFIYLAGVTLMAIAWLNQKYIFKNVSADRFMFVVIGFFLLRFSLFDSIWNLAAGQDFFYYGSTKLYDITMTKLGTFGWMLKGIAGLWGIAWLMDWRKGIMKVR